MPQERNSKLSLKWIRLPSVQLSHLGDLPECHVPQLEPGELDFKLVLLLGECRSSTELHCPCGLLCMKEQQSTAPQWSCLIAGGHLWKRLVKMSSLFLLEAVAEEIPCSAWSPQPHSLTYLCSTPRKLCWFSLLLQEVPDETSSFSRDFCYVVSVCN